MTIDLKSLIFEAREMDLSSHMIFSFDSELCALAILERISGLEPLSVTRAPRYVNWLTCSSVVQFTFYTFCMDVRHDLCFYSVDFHSILTSALVES